MKIDATELQDRLVEYLYDELDAEQRAQVEAGLEQHPDLRAELEALRETSMLVERGLTDLEPPSAVSSAILEQARRAAPGGEQRLSFGEKLRRWIASMTMQQALGTAFTVMLVAGVSLYAYRLQSPSPTTEEGMLSMERSRHAAAGLKEAEKKANKIVAPNQELDQLGGGQQVAAAPATPAAAEPNDREVAQGQRQADPNKPIELAKRGLYDEAKNMVEGAKDKRVRQVPGNVRYQLNNRNENLETSGERVASTRGAKAPSAANDLPSATVPPQKTPQSVGKGFAKSQLSQTYRKRRAAQALAPKKRALRWDQSSTKKRGSINSPYGDNYNSTGRRVGSSYGSTSITRSSAKPRPAKRPPVRTKRRRRMAKRDNDDIIGSIKTGKYKGKDEKVAAKPTPKAKPQTKPGKKKPSLYQRGVAQVRGGDCAGAISTFNLLLSKQPKQSANVARVLGRCRSRVSRKRSRRVYAAVVSYERAAREVAARKRSKKRASKVKAKRAAPKAPTQSNSAK